jgi:hypothetical protein
MAELLKLEQFDNSITFSKENNDALRMTVMNEGEQWYTYFDISDEQVSTLIHTLQQYLINKIKQP